MSCSTAYIGMTYRSKEYKLGLYLNNYKQLRTTHGRTAPGAGDRTQPLYKGIDSQMKSFNVKYALFPSSKTD